MKYYNALEDLVQLQLKYDFDNELEEDRIFARKLDSTITHLEQQLNFLIKQKIVQKNKLHIVIDKEGYRLYTFTDSNLQHYHIIWDVEGTRVFSRPIYDFDLMKYNLYEIEEVTDEHILVKLKEYIETKYYLDSQKLLEDIKIQ